MRILPIALVFLLLAGAGIWVAAKGPDAFPRSTPPIIAITNDGTTDATINAGIDAVSPLPPPNGFSVTGTTVDSVLLSWQPVPEARAYRLYRNGQAIAQLSSVRFLDIGLTPATTYEYTVASVDMNQQPSAPSAAVRTQTNPSSTAATNANTVSSKPSPTPSPKPSPTPAPTPAPSAPACGSGGACTASQVASHATRGNCWVYLSPINKTYNITAYVANSGRHPGGDVIASHCGQNIYSYFIGSAGGHSHSSSALSSVLQAYYIGPFQP